MLLDEILPVYDFTEVHTILIEANPEVAFSAMMDVTISEISSIMRLLFFLRELPERAVGRKITSMSSSEPMLSSMLNNGFTRLGEQDSREVVFGLIVPEKIGRVWHKSSNLDAPISNSKEFFAFNNPGYLKVVANLLVKDSGTPGIVIMRTESRTRALSDHARKSFAPYWRIIRPFSGLIRRLWLKGIKRRAEQVSYKSICQEKDLSADRV